MLVVAVADVSLNQTTLNMNAGGDTATLTASVKPDNATYKTVTWTTSDASVATVSGGVVTSVGAGTATITATATNGTDDTSDDKSASCNVTVHAHSFTYSASGATITATCSNTDGCPLSGSEYKATLTIAAPAKTTYGDANSAEATITDANSIKGDATIQYQTKSGDTYGTVTTTAPTDAGDYKASITVGGATASVEYTIAKANPTANAPTGLTATYGQTLANVSLEGKNPEGNTPGTWAWADSTQSVGNVVDPAATFKANFTPTSSNYKTVENVDVTVTVGKADPTAPTSLTATYGQTLANVTLPDGWTWADSTQSVGNIVDPAATFKANFAGDDNHNAASNVDVTVTVGKANAVAATVTANSRTYDGTEKPLVTVTGEPTGGEMQYALGTATEATQPYTTDIPTATNAGTYYVWYMVVGDDNHNDSDADCVEVTIKKKSSGGGGGGGAAPATNPITVATVSNGRVSVSPTSAKAGDKVTVTATPDAGWQADQVTVTDKNGKTVPVTKNADGTCSFTMPASAVTVKADFSEKAEPTPTPTPPADDGSCPKDSTCPISKFTDSEPAAWYHDGVHWALEKGVMKGVSDTAFAPNGSATRSMVVTMLWRLAGEPAASAPAPFADVNSDAWYAPAVAWAAETGAVNGTGSATFSPDTAVTREQLAAILYRYAQAQGKGFTGAWAFPLNFPDAAKVSEYANEAMHWMTQKGVITGMGDGTLAPQDNATRAQIATMFMRFVDVMEK